MSRPTIFSVRQKIEAADADLSIVGNDLFDKKLNARKDKAVREARSLLRRAIDVLRTVRWDI